MAWALSFNINIDGAFVSQSHFDGVYGCCNTTIRQRNNYTIYDVQSLPLGNHSLALLMLDTYGIIPNAGDNGSRILFDYAVVNETALTGSPLPSLIPQHPYVYQPQF
jgi:hypothetical protein